MKNFVTTCVVCFMLSVCSSIQADTVYVATDGNDTTGDGSLENPYKTIQKGVDVAISGDEVVLKLGTYTGDGNRDIDFVGLPEPAFFYEDFETGDFSKYNWGTSGDANWAVVSGEAIEGSYCVKSGAITDNQQSILEITLDIEDCSISFLRRVSSESGYDFLRFYIDDVQKGLWSGDQDWLSQTYRVTAGQHTFKWAYEKDYSVYDGSDCAWIDEIKFYITSAKAITVRSIDPNNASVVASTIVDCQGTVANPHRAFSFRSGGTAETLINGLAITNGYGPDEDLVGTPESSGGAIFCFGSSLILKNCSFVNNKAIYGGAICGAYDASLQIVNCFIADNEAEWGGGGIFFVFDGNLIINNCTIGENVAEYDGGGILLYQSTLTIKGCAINGNVSGQNGGGVSCSENSDAIFRNCIFSGNKAVSTTQVTSEGGGIATEDSNISVINCTLHGNITNFDGGGIAADNSTVAVTNSIMWEDEADRDGNEVDLSFGSSLTLSHSCVQEGWPGEGNIDTNPLFTDPKGPDIIIGTEDDNLRLAPGSPCINTGDPNYVPGPGEIDLDGNPRVIGSQIDMGAYEWPAMTLYVDNDAIGANDGSSWTDSFTELQSALDAADAAMAGGEIWVAAGTYLPDCNVVTGVHTGSRRDTFQLINGVVIYGGFAGTETSLEQRDVKNNETILSGDLSGNDVGFINNGDNSFHVVTGTGTDVRAIIDGFTITGGNANGPISLGESSGAGMYNYSGSPTVSNCTFSGNYAANTLEWGYGGGGMFNEDNSSPMLTNCSFVNNVARFGGGLYNIDYSSPTLVNCTFTGNVAIEGGAVHSYWNSAPVITNCSIIGNTADANGGGLYGCVGPISNTIIWANIAPVYPQMHSSSIPSYSCVQDWAGGGIGNIDTNPLFLDADGADDIPGTEDDNLRLKTGSSCIDAGDPCYVGDPCETDLDGLPRIVDGNCDSTATVDMGAYEFNWLYVGDFEGDDCDVDFGDFAVLADSFQKDNPAIDIAPYLDPDGIIDFKELLVIVDYWLKGTDY